MANCEISNLVYPKAKMMYTNIGDSQVSIINLGLMQMSPVYGTPASEEESLATIFEALDSGVNFLDTADAYGFGHNETLLGKAIKQRKREEFFISTKFGIARDEKTNQIGINGKPEYVKEACDKSLKRLGIDYIDLYYLHRVDPTTPIEDTVRAMSQLVKEGKVKYIGLSEVSAETLRRVHAIHPISAVQSELSLFTLDPLQNGVISTCKELGIKFIAYSPLGRGFLTGKFKSIDDFEPTDWRRTVPRFQGDNFQKNLDLVNKVNEIAKQKNITPSQLALAWVLSKGEHIIPLFGTKKREYLRENLKSVEVTLLKEEIDKIDEILKTFPVEGERYAPDFMKLLNL